MAEAKKKRKAGKGGNPATSDNVTMGGEAPHESLPASPSSLHGPGHASGPQSSSGGRAASKRVSRPSRPGRRP